MSFRIRAPIRACALGLLPPRPEPGQPYVSRRGRIRELRVERRVVSEAIETTDE